MSFRGGGGCGRNGGRPRPIKERRELEIDQAKPAIGGSVGDIAHFRVVMPNAERLQFGKELLAAFLAEVVDTGAAVGRDNLQVFRIDLKQAGDEGAPPRFQMLEHANFILKSVLGEVSPEGLMDPTVIADADERSSRVFDLVHGLRWWVGPRQATRRPNEGESLDWAGLPSTKKPPKILTFD
jgi:hypothetical protein